MEETKNEDFSAIVRMLDRLKTDSSFPIDLETRLLEEVGLDSIALIDLVEEIQRDLKVDFQPEDYSFENFRSVASILEIVNRRRDAAISPAK